MTNSLINKLIIKIAISLQSRPREKKCIETPAPGQYSIDKAGNQISDKAPRYTFGLKHTNDKISQTPGMLISFSINSLN